MCRPSGSMNSNLPDAVRHGLKKTEKKTTTEDLRHFFWVRSSSRQEKRANFFLGPKLLLNLLQHRASMVRVGILKMAKKLRKKHTISIQFHYKQVTKKQKNTFAKVNKAYKLIS